MSEKKSPILILQFRRSDAHVEFERSVYMRAAGDTTTLSFLSIFDETIPWHQPARILDEYRAVILGGSGDLFFDGGRSPDDPARQTTEEVFERAKPLIEYIFEKNIPILGVCFGHQLVARVQGVTVSNNKSQAKVGSYPVLPTEKAATLQLFQGIEKEFIAQFAHKDSLNAVPIGAEVIVSGKQCNYSALWYGGHRYTVQFHPELEAEDMIKRLAGSSEYLPEGKKLEDIVQPSLEASLLLKNFFELVKQKTN